MEAVDEATGKGLYRVEKIIRAVHDNEALLSLGCS